MSKVVEAAQGANVFSALVTKIMAILKLDDAGKIDKFFKNEVKNLNSQIEGIDMNKQTAALRYKMDLSEIDSKIEDAEEAVEDSFAAVSVEDINSNEAMKQFSVKYWSGVQRAENLLEELKNKRKAIVEAYDKELESRNEQIAKREARIAKIS
jgi:hypothetical protein